MTTTNIVLFAGLMLASAVLVAGCQDNLVPCNDPATCANPDLGGYCGDGIIQTGANEQCDDGNSDPNDGCDRCRLWSPPHGDPLTLGETGAWTYYTVDGAVCRDGSPAGFSINPGTGKDAHKLLFYFEGGGACFNATTCNINPAFIAGEPAPGNDGIFNRDNNENPFRHWTIIYLPYCTGDVFAGSRQHVDVPNGPKNQQFVGYTNVGLFLDRIAPTFGPSVQRVVSSGSSAGGLGALANAIPIARAFPNAHLTVLDDSGPPLSNNVVTACLQQAIQKTWGVGSTVVADCGRACMEPGNYLLPAVQNMVSNYTRIDFGFFDFTHDVVMRMFYSFGLEDCAMSMENTMPPLLFETGLFEFRDKMLAADLPVATFLYPSLLHTCLQTNCFYNLTLQNVNLAQWTSDLLHGSFQQIAKPVQ